METIHKVPVTPDCLSVCVCVCSCVDVYVRVRGLRAALLKATPPG